MRARMKIESPDAVEVILIGKLTAENEKLRAALNLWVQYDDALGAPFDGPNAVFGYGAAIIATREALGRQPTT